MVTRSDAVELLPAGVGSLARGLPPCAPGTLFALGRRGGIRVAPTAHLDVVFGRNEPEVHVCVGEDDPRVSRQHGLLHCDGRRWTVRNTGTVPIRFPGSQLLLSGHSEPLPTAYTPLFIRTGADREHLLELRVATAPLTDRRAEHDENTERPSTWTLDADEKLVLVTLGQRYLRHEAHPQPQSWSQVAAELGEVRPDQGWTGKRAEHVVRGVRLRLVAVGVRGLVREEVGEPVGNMLNHNLVVALLLSTTLVPPDLALLDGPGATAS